MTPRDLPPDDRDDPLGATDALRAAKQSLRHAMRRRREEQAVRMLEPAFARAIDELAAAEALRVIDEGIATAFALTYAALSGEVPTAGLDAGLRARGWMLHYPRIVTRRPAILEARETRSLGDLRPGQYGILEPPADEERFPSLPAETIDLVIVPGLAFDRNGGRLGQGAGFYDQFLSRCFIAWKVGLAFDWQMVDAVPMDEERDVRLNDVIVVPSNPPA